MLDNAVAAAVKPLPWAARVMLTILALTVISAAVWMFWQDAESEPTVTVTGTVSGVYTGAGPACSPEFVTDPPPIGYTCTLTDILVSTSTDNESASIGATTTLINVPGDHPVGAAITQTWTEPATPFELLGGENLTRLLLVVVVGAICVGFGTRIVRRFRPVSGMDGHPTD